MREMTTASSRPRGRDREKRNARRQLGVSNKRKEWVGELELREERNGGRERKMREGGRAREKDVMMATVVLEDTY